MAKKRNPADYIEPIIMNGLRGRMLRMPAPKNKHREILFIYGHHASIERQFGLIEVLNRYGSVTVPDLPGFGGMQSFYKIGEKPSIDNLADYLASFVKLRYKNKRKKITIAAVSLGFVVTTRMLQKYPDIAKKVDLLISIVGFAHHEEFRFTRSTFLFFRYGASFFSRRVPAWFGRTFVLRPFVIRSVYKLMASTNPKLKDADKEEQNERIDFEIVLWRINDLRTYMDTTVSMMKLNLCNVQVDLPVYHVAVAHDRYFDNSLVEQHLGVIYNKVEVIPARMPAHAPTVIADAKAAAGIMPLRIRRLLAKQ